jgi:hypothetical protein
LISQNYFGSFFDRQNIKPLYMKNLFLLLFCCLVTFSFKADSLKLDKCECNNIPLYGKVQFVESFPDFKVQFVESFPDLKVKFVDFFPNECGKWQIVDDFPDFKVQIVEYFPDFKVEIVDDFPGIP